MLSTDHMKADEMTVQQKVDIQKVGRRYAELVRERDLPVRALWVSGSERFPDLWILTDRIDDLDDLRPVYQALGNMQAEFPDLFFDHRLLNPAWSPHLDVAAEIPADARKIKLTK